MKIRNLSDYPCNSTRILIPTVAIKGWKKSGYIIVLAWWTWKLGVDLRRGL